MKMTLGQTNLVTIRHSLWCQQMHIWWSFIMRNKYNFRYSKSVIIITAIILYGCHKIPQHTWICLTSLELGTSAVMHMRVRMDAAFQIHKKRDLALIRDDGFFLSVSFVYWPPYNDVNLISSSNHYQSQACHNMIQSIYNKTVLHTEATAIPTGTFRGQRKQQRTEVANYSHNIFSGCSCTL